MINLSKVVHCLCNCQWCTSLPLPVLGKRYCWWPLSWWELTHRWAMNVQNVGKRTYKFRPYLLSIACGCLCKLIPHVPFSSFLSALDFFAVLQKLYDFWGSLKKSMLSKHLWWVSGGRVICCCPPSSVLVQSPVTATFLQEWALLAFQLYRWEKSVTYRQGSLRMFS